MIGIAMRIFNFSPETGELLSESLADESPMEPGVFLVPANATAIEPPTPQERQWPVWRDGAWTMVADWRNVPLWAAGEGRAAAPLITELGKTPDDIGATRHAPPPVGERQVAVYEAGVWTVQVDLRGVPLWSTATGEPVVAPSYGVGAEELGATLLEPPSYPARFEGGQWVADRAAIIERSRRVNGGFPWAGKWFHSDAASKLQYLANKDTARDQVSEGAIGADMLMDPATELQIAWKTMDGSFLPLTVQLALDIVKAAKAAEFQHFRVAEAHRAALATAADPLTYDITTGWPAVFGE